MIKPPPIVFVKIFKAESGMNCVKTALLILIVSPKFFNDVSLIDTGNFISLNAFTQSSAFIFSFPERSGEAFLQPYKINIDERQNNKRLMPVLLLKIIFKYKELKMIFLGLPKNYLRDP